MGFLDTFKEVALQAKEKAIQLKNEYDTKKAEQAALKLEMEQKADDYKNSIVEKILQFSKDDEGIFENITNDELIRFTTDFAEKLFLPANSSSASNIIIHPYINARHLKNIKLNFSFDEKVEPPLIYFKTKNNQEFLFTRDNLRFKVALPEDNKFFSVGCVPNKNISNYNFETTDDGYVFMCDNVTLAKFGIDKVYSQDFVTLNDYFSRIKNKHFEISSQEINELIKEKIGNDIYNEFKKYFTYDNELSIFFAWGCDSITAKDYIICTDKQIIIMNRELMGTTANAKQFYYEDITSIQTIQNTNSGSLTGYLLNSALIAAFDVCDLLITVAGASNRINSLYKNEADRIVSIYHQQRKEIKSSLKTPTIIQQSSNEPDPIDQLQKLAKLKESGIITEDEYNAKKAILMDKI